MIFRFVSVLFYDFSEQKHDESLEKHGQESGQYHEDNAESNEKR